MEVLNHLPVGKPFLLVAEAQPFGDLHEAVEILLFEF